MAIYVLSLLLALLHLTASSAAFVIRSPDMAPAAAVSFDEATQQALRQAHEFELSYRASPSVHEDAFYSLPDGCADAQPGTLLKVEQYTNTSRYALAPNLSMSRFIYQSRTSNGTLVPVSGYVLWPYIVSRKHRKAPGYPVVAWAHGTSGVNEECAPSNIQNLWHHFQAPYQLALNGYVVVATDYAGLGIGKDAAGRTIVHEYMTAPAQANDVLYSIQAAQKAFPELSKEFVILGSSQGGAAAWSCAEKLHEQPQDGYLGTISLSPVSSVADLIVDKDSTIVPMLMLMVAPSLVDKFPDFTLDQIFNDVGVQSVNAYVEYTGCNTVLFNLPLSKISLKEAWLTNPTVQKYIDVSRVGNKKVAGPMLVMTGAADPIVFPPSVQNIVSKTAARQPELPFEFYLLPDVSHAPAMYSGWQVYLDWIEDRFAGRPARHGFSNGTVDPIRPASAQQIEANWFIQNFTASWQLT